MRGDDWLKGALPTVLLPVDEEPTADDLNEMLVNVKTYVYCHGVAFTFRRRLRSFQVVVTPRLSSLLCLCLSGRRKS